MHFCTPLHPPAPPCTPCRYKAAKDEEKAGEVREDFSDLVAEHGDMVRVGGGLDDIATVAYWCAALALDSSIQAPVWVFGSAYWHLLRDCWFTR